MDEPAPSAAPRSAGWLFPAAAFGLAVAAGLAWVVLRPGSQVDTSPVPTSAATTLMPTPSAYGSTASVTFTVTSVRSTPYRTVRLEIHRRNDELTISASSAKEKGRPTALVFGAVSANRPSWYSTDDVLQLALMPGYTKGIATVGRASIQAAYLAPVDLTAALIEHAPEEPGRDFFWADNRGAIHNSRAAVVTSAAIETDVYSVTVFEDAELGVWGYFDSNVQVVEPIAQEPIGTLKVASVSAGAATSGPKTLNWLAMLPPGATQLELEADDSVTWGSAQLGATGRLVIAGSNEVVKKGHTGVRSITYVDASGNREIVKP